MQLRPGIYETLIYNALKQKIDELPSIYHVNEMPIDSAEAPRVLTDYVAELLELLLGDDKVFETIEERIEFVNRVIRFIEEKWNFEPDDDLLTNQNRLLGGIIDSTGKSPEQLKALDLLRPKSGFTVNSLFTGNNNGLSMQSELSMDILTADRIYWIVAFIRFSGVRIFKDALEKFLSRENTKLCIITTTYMAASEPKAVEFLKNLNPSKVDIKVCYDTSMDRLHAKSYIFERNSGLDTAYIGSSNISRSALTQGLEWNVRITAKESPQIIKAAKATFETYWNRDDFEPYDPIKFQNAINDEKHRDPDSSRSTVLHQYTVRPEQKEILDQLTTERQLHGSYKNLVVAATGTGKTVIAAFDYRRFLQSHPKHNLLFIAHREEILEQSLATFRSVLNDSTFGEIWVGKHQPSMYGDLRHLFVSIQTFNSRSEMFESFGKEYYDFVIIDEAHHSQANSYRLLFQMFEPKILLGLTATPEREDGQSLLPDFNNRIAAELRLPEAINRFLLSPFQYFCIGDETVNLMNIAWNSVSGTYDEDDLFRALNTESRLKLITETIPKYLSDENDCRALCFCCRKEHAKDVAAGLRAAGYRAEALTSDDSDEGRKAKIDSFRKKRINYLCVVDIFNEGVDVPEIDTVLFLRPTKSLTIFLQQLGRGLRLSADKDCLTVLDYVAQANNHYSYESRFNALIDRYNTKDIKRQVAEGFDFLPRGCSIKMDKIAQKYILDNIKQAVWNKQRILRELASYSSNFSDVLTLGSFLDHFDLDPRAVYKVKCWSEFLRETGRVHYVDDKYSLVYVKNMSQLIHVNSNSYLKFIRELVDKDFHYEHTDKNNLFALMLYYELYGQPIKKFGFNSIDEALNTFAQHAVFVDELRQLVDYQIDHLNVITTPIEGFEDSPIELFGRYTRVEQLILLGRITAEKVFNPQSGVYSLDDRNTELLWVTLNKSDKDFSPSTQYNDYAINENLFHWQSQNGASHEKTGRRYVEQAINKRKFLLFVRENKEDMYNFTEAYYCLGPVEYVSSTGDKPMNITWRLKNKIPGFILDKAQKLAVG